MWLEISWGVVPACPMLVLLGAMRAVGGDAVRIIGVSLHEHCVPQSVAHSGEHVGVEMSHKLWDISHPASLANRQ